MTDEEDTKRKGKAENVYQREQFENMIDEDTSSAEIQEIKVSRVGYIEMKKLGSKKGWKVMHCVLIGGSFYWYKTAKASEPLGGCDLRDCEIENNVKVGNKDCFTFKSTADESELFVGHITSETNRDSWVQSLNENRENYEPQPSPAREEIKTKKVNIVNRTRNAVVSKTATSAIGKKVMKAIINEETAALLDALKKIVKKESGSPKKADDLEKNIIKIAVKAFLIIEKGKLDGEAFLKADRPLRDAFDLLSRCYSGKSRVNQDVFYDALLRIEGLLRESEEIITNVLAPYLTSKNLFRVASAFGTLADAKFLQRVFYDDTLDDDLGKLVDAMDYYTQFHFN